MRQSPSGHAGRVNCTYSERQARRDVAQVGLANRAGVGPRENRTPTNYRIGRLPDVHFNPKSSSIHSELPEVFVRVRRDVACQSSVPPL